MPEEELPDVEVAAAPVSVGCSSCQKIHAVDLIGLPEIFQCSQKMVESLLRFAIDYFRNASINSICCISRSTGGYFSCLISAGRSGGRYVWLSFLTIFSVFGSFNHPQSEALKLTRVVA
ncbi:hypothetical protein [Herbaspirillum camelliae]|uniref:hypothetical protein n=1 Tax=Herbaspirillum camelliae TaxID=1892903 RepID=UPI00117BA63D|nr:hypothetical protein [Herbaspirillum camelliae]